MNQEEEEMRKSQVLIKYLHELQYGRSIPDRHGHGTVRESKDNIGDIVAVKELINKILFNE
jgi:hypothetical protein